MPALFWDTLPARGVRDFDQQRAKRALHAQFSEGGFTLAPCSHSTFNPLVGSSSLPRPTSENGMFCMSLETDGVRDFAIRFVFVLH